MNDESNLPFGLLFSLQSTLQQPLLAGLTAVSVAMSVALAVSLYMSSSAVSIELARTGRALIGNTDIEVTSGAVGIHEDLLGEVEGVAGVEQVAPVLSTLAWISRGPYEGRPLRILGVDVLADQEMRGYSVVQNDLRVMDPLALVAGADSVVVSEVLAGKLGLELGSGLPVRVETGEHTLTVRGILASGGVGDAYGGQIVVMDVYALQGLLARPGWLERVDVTVAEGRDIDAVMEALRVRLAGRASVRLATTASGFVSAAMATIRLAAGLIAGMGILLAAFLSYVAMSASVRSRTREFSQLRAAGLGSNRVVLMLLVESLFISALGTVLGIPLGVWLARALSPIFAGTTRFIQGDSIADPQFSASVLAAAVAVGVGVSWAGSVVPSLRVARVQPLEFISGQRIPATRLDARVVPRPWIVAGLATVIVAIAHAAPIGIPAAAKALLVIGGGVAALTAALGSGLNGIWESLTSLFDRVYPGMGRLICMSLHARIPRSRVLAASLTAVLAATSAVLVVGMSVADTFGKRTAPTGGVVVTTSDLLGSLKRAPILQETAAIIASTPGVAAVFHHFPTSILYQGKEVILSAISADVAGRYFAYRDIDPAEWRDISKRMIAGGIVISHGFAKTFRIEIGDHVALDTPLGSRTFTVVGEIESYDAGPTGRIRMHLPVFDELWPRSSFSNLIIWTDGPRDKVLDLIVERTQHIQPLFFTLRNKVISMSEDLVAESVGLLYLLFAVIGTLSGLAALNQVATSAMTWRRDLALFRAAGATNSNVLVLVMAEGVAVALISSGAGLLFGLASANSLLGVMRETLGWSIQMAVLPGPLASLALAVLIGCGSAALLPSLRARRVALRQELLLE